MQLFVSYIPAFPSYRTNKSKMKHAKLRKVAHLANAEKYNCALELGPSLGEKLIELSSLHSHLILLADATFSMELSTLKLEICCEPNEDKFLGSSGKYSLEIKNGDHSMVRQDYVNEVPWSMLGLRQKILAEFDRSLHRKEGEELLLFEHPKIKITYYQGALHYEDELGSGVWYEGSFMSEEQHKVMRQMKQDNEVAGHFIRLVSNVLRLALSNHDRLLSFIDENELSKVINCVAQLVSRNSSKISRDIARPYLTNGKLFIETMKKSPEHVRALEKEWRDLKKILETIYQGKIERKQTLDELKEQFKEQNDQTAMLLQAREMNNVWRFSQEFNSSVKEFCSIIIDQTIDKQLISLKTPVKTRRFEDFYCRVLFEIRQVHKPVIQICRSIWPMQEGQLDLVVRDYSDPNAILRWELLSKCSPNEFAFCRLQDLIIFLAGNHQHDSVFTVRSLSISAIYEALSRGEELPRSEELPLEFSKQCCSVSSLNNRVTVALSNKTIMHYSSGSLETKYPAIDLSKNPNAKDPMFAFKHFDANCLAVVMFNEVYFSVYFAKYSSNYELETKKLHDTLFDDLNIKRNGSLQPKKFSFIGENQYRYPLLIHQPHGCVMLFPYKLMKFELIYVTNRGECSLMHSQNQMHPLLKAIERLPPPAQNKKPVQKPVNPSHYSFFETDLESKSVINIICYDFGRQTTQDNGIDIIRCMLKL